MEDTENLMITLTAVNIFKIQNMHPLLTPALFITHGTQRQEC